mmetsp:Transcript_99005/g.285710  ORF Transcript_99005/g.285710 Transcript_99005/m.285710 type:complete len:81 (-) Transcript_99005:649-891(-)
MIAWKSFVFWLDCSIQPRIFPLQVHLAPDETKVLQLLFSKRQMDGFLYLLQNRHPSYVFSSKKASHPRSLRLSLKDLFAP